MHSNLYNNSRQMLFVQRQATLFQHRWALAAATLAGVMFLIALATAYFKPGGLGQIQGIYLAIFYVVGLIFTSQIFMELNHPHQAYAFLTLPVSALEKLIGSWLLTSPLYVLVFTVISTFLYLVAQLVAEVPLAPQEYLNAEFWESVGSYMVMQTIFLWGACYFRKNNFLKTVLTILVFSIALGMYAGLLLWMVMDKTSFTPEDAVVINQNDPGIEDMVALAFNILHWGVFGPYMLLISYFTLKERQL